MNVFMDGKLAEAVRISCGYRWIFVQNGLNRAIFSRNPLRMRVSAQLPLYY
jgi:hypothetical protein